MKTIFTFLLTVITVFTFTSAFSQLNCTGGRYLNEIFPTVTTTTNILYGNNLNVSGNPEDLFLDVYEPTGDTETNRPLIIMAHGGSFVAGDKADGCVDAMCKDFAKMGYVTASINYRMFFEGFPPFCPDSVKGTETVMRATHDAKAAVRFFRKNFVEGGNTYGIDTSLIFFAGQSAGAFMALHLAYVDEPSEVPVDTTKPGLLGGVEGNSGNPGYSSKVTAIISMAGALGDTAWMKPGDTPIISFHGDLDGTVPFGTQMIQLLGICNIFEVDGSNSVHIKANELGINNCFIPYWGQDHLPECDPPANPAYTDTSVTFIKHFLLQFVCCDPFMCSYTPIPADTVVVANDDAATTNQGTSVVINVQSNDIGIDCSPLTTIILSGPSNGNADTLNGSNIQYTPNPGFIGTDTITYEVCDNSVPPLCDQAMAIITVTSGVGIDGLVNNQNKIMIYPNPANNYVKLDLENIHGQEYTIELFDHMGRLVRNYNDQTTAEFIMNRSGLSSGLYFINIISGNSNYTGKVIFE